MTGVVVVGGGMAGVACAAEVGRKGVEVVLYDSNDYLQFQPLLYQVASSQLPAEDVARPLAVVFDDVPTVTVRQSDVTCVDLATREVTSTDGSAVRGDRGRRLAAAPDDGSGVQAGAVRQVHSVRLDPGDRQAEGDLHAVLGELAQSVLLRLLRDENGASRAEP